LSQYGGGYAEYVLVPSYKFLVNADNLDPVQVAPLTDAGLTPYRAVKKVKHLLDPGTFALVLGVGGLGSYAIQYLKLLTQASVIAIVRNDEKGKLARRMDADYVINSKVEDVGQQIRDITSGQGIDVSIDLVSSEETVGIATSNLAKRGTIVMVGLIGKSVRFPVTEAVLNEFNLIGSLWGNYNELKEVIELAKMKKIKSAITQYKLEDANNVLDLLNHGRISGRAVLTP
jgi:propanol-preferring alcohol dehydrogenase